MPTLKLVHSINIKDFNINDIINYVVLLSNPFPMICCASSNNIFLFDINGELINRLKIENDIKFYIDKNCGLFNDSIISVVNNEEKEYALIPNKNSISNSIKSN